MSAVGALQTNGIGSDGRRAAEPLASELFEPVRPARDHEVEGADQRPSVSRRGPEREALMRTKS